MQSTWKSTTAGILDIIAGVWAAHLGLSHLLEAAVLDDSVYRLVPHIDDT